MSGNGVMNGMDSEGRLEKEIETWKGFPWALRKDDLEAWNAMVDDVRAQFADAVEGSGRTFTTDAFFMALILAQQKMIREIRVQLGSAAPETGRVSSLDGWLQV